MTDDQSFLIIGDIAGHVIVYSKNGSTYIQSQILSDAYNTINRLHMTNDASHTYLITASTDSNARLYIKNGSSLDLIDTFIGDSSIVLSCWMSDDFNYLMFGTWLTDFFVYASCQILNCLACNVPNQCN